MAWRDSRTSRGRLLFFSCSIVLGIAALTAIGSLGRNLERAIEEQSKSLLGADLVIGSRQAFTPAEENLFREIGGQQARETSFSSMIYFVATSATRLVQVRALEGGFPFYGRLETAPPEAADVFRRGGGALVEESLLTQFNAKVGDRIRLGQLTVPITGALKKVPGETVAFATIAPRVYLAMADLPRTGLVREGSLVRYRVSFKLPPEVDPGVLMRRLKPRMDENRLSHSTVAQRQRDLGRSMDNLYHFMNLVGLVALLLGGVGVASAIHVHVKQKLSTVAVLRCLGGSVGGTFAVYLAQGVALGLFGVLLGTSLGVAMQATLPKVLADFLPFTFVFHTSWWAVARAAGIGFAICLLFALLPLLAVRRVPPLAALRVSAGSQPPPRDPARWLVGTLLGAGILGFALAQGHDWRVGLGFAGGLGVVFGLLTLTARGLMAATRRFTPATLPFAVRQGVANLHRPNNRTLLLLLALGLGTFLLVSLWLVQQTLLTQLIRADNRNQPNAILFDIQPDQRDAVSNLVHSLNLPILDEAPIVTMRLSTLKGRTVEAILAERKSGIPNWTLRREYRSTYYDHLRDSEKIIAGRWEPRVTNAQAAVPISVEDSIAKELHVGLGDEITFDVQGVPIKTRVASLREVDWRRVQPNFFMVFPLGVLEHAPVMNVLVTRVGSAQESARLQREVVSKFPNVSAIDLTLVLETLDSILNKISFVVRFMAMFTVLTGGLVLVGALATGRFQRVQESILLRTLGASRSQVFRVLLAEYLALGILAALTGVLLASAAAWALAVFLFEAKFVPAPWALLTPLLLVPALTVVSGFLMSRGVLNHPPLAILRAEAP
jgi:putative ABC transport system permease protein